MYWYKKHSPLSAGFTCSGVGSGCCWLSSRSRWSAPHSGCPRPPPPPQRPRPRPSPPARWESITYTCDLSVWRKNWQNIFSYHSNQSGCHGQDRTEGYPGYSTRIEEKYFYLIELNGFQWLTFILEIRILTFVISRYWHSVYRQFFPGFTWNYQ